MRIQSYRGGRTALDVNPTTGDGEEARRSGVKLSLSDRLDRFQRNHPWASFPIAVIYKFFDDQGSYLAALITYYGFVSLFPLLLLLSTVLDFALHNDPSLQQKVLSSALGQFPVIGQQLGDPRGVSGSGVGLAVGILGTLYGGLGVGQVIQHAMNVAWMVPRNSRPNPLKSRGRGLLLLVVAGGAVLATTVLSGLGVSARAFGSSVGAGLKILLFGSSIGINLGVFLLTFRVATARTVTTRTVLPGALLAAIAWQLLQTFGAVYVTHVVKNASATNGVFALVLGLVGWIYLEAIVIVFAVEINVVRALRLYPRALLTPFTDNVNLTPADEFTYRDQAEAQRAKGFEDIDVRFDPPQAGADSGESWS
jgi:membrane protein